MAVKINIPVKSNSYRMTMQLTMLHSVMCARQRKEIRILSYLVRHNTGGVYLLRKGFRVDIAKGVSSTPAGVKEALRSLQHKKMIKFVANGQGSSYGVYSFSKAVESLCKGEESVTFNFVNK